MYFLDKIITTVSRQTYTGDKSAFASVGALASTPCYLRPMSPEQSAVNGYQYGQAFDLIVDTGTDLREMDKVTINGVVYTVRGMVDHNRGGITAYAKAVLTKGEGE